MKRDVPPRPRPPVPPMPPAPEPRPAQFAMTNVEIAEAIEYARSSIYKSNCTTTRHRFEKQLFDLLDVQLERAKKISLDENNQR